MTCVYDAPRLVEGECAPESGEHWRGPNGHTLLFWEADFRPGGASRLCLRSSEGRDHWVEGVYLEIVEPERVVVTGNLGLNGERLPETAGTLTFRRT